MNRKIFLVFAIVAAFCSLLTSCYGSCSVDLAGKFDIYYVLSQKSLDSALANVRATVTIFTKGNFSKDIIEIDGDKLFCYKNPNDDTYEQKYCNKVDDKQYLYYRDYSGKWIRSLVTKEEYDLFFAQAFIIRHLNPSDMEETDGYYVLKKSGYNSFLSNLAFSADNAENIDIDYVRIKVEGSKVVLFELSFSNSSTGGYMCKVEYSDYGKINIALPITELEIAFSESNIETVIANVEIVHLRVSGGSTALVVNVDGDKIYSYRVINGAKTNEKYFSSEGDNYFSYRNISGDIWLKEAIEKTEYLGYYFGALALFLFDIDDFEASGGYYYIKGYALKDYFLSVYAAAIEEILIPDFIKVKIEDNKVVLVQFAFTYNSAYYTDTYEYSNFGTTSVTLPLTSDTLANL